MLSINFKTLFICLSLILCLGCGEDLKPAEFTASSTVPTTPVNDGPNEAQDQTQIYVKLKDPSFLTFINSSGLWNQTCSIDKDVTGNVDLDCLIDIQELDLYMNQLELEYNFPTGMCEYVTSQAPWHWNHSSGKGPKEVTISIDTSGASPVPGDTDPSLSGCTAKLEDDTEVACALADELTPISESFEVDCIYDYSKEKQGLPNCCYGDYTLIKHTDETGNSVPDEIVTTNKKWGTSIKECIGGIGRTDWTLYTPSGYPNGRIEPAKDGISNTISIKSNASSLLTTFSYQATYFETIAAPHNHNGYVSAATSDKPYAVEPIDDLDGSPIVSGNPSFIFTCKDTGGENIHRVNVHLREWNTLEDFLNYADTNGVTVNSDVVGIEGVDCDYDSIFNSSLCNDYIDFKDILTSVGGSYTTDNTAPSPNAIRRTYFPQVEY